MIQAKKKTKGINPNAAMRWIQALLVNLSHSAAYFEISE